MASVNDTQNKQILEYMRENTCITPMDALKEFGCMRLAARIADLKAAGHHIIKEFGYQKGKRGKAVRYARYFLIEEDDE